MIQEKKNLKSDMVLKYQNSLKTMKNQNLIKNVIRLRKFVKINLYIGFVLIIKSKTTLLNLNDFLIINFDLNNINILI